MEFLFFEKEIEKIQHKIDRAKSSKKVNSEKLNLLEKDLIKKIKEAYKSIDPMKKIAIARHSERPLSSDYINTMVDNFQEVSGDRRFGDDKAIIAGLGFIKGQPVAVIAQERGNDIESRVKRNFGQAKPEGYRKAIRVMKMAEKFSIPVITLIDTSGAYPGKEAEERGQAQAIAESIKTCLDIKTPIIAVVIGEGGSGGAIAIGATDKVIMLEHSIYSIISAEGCAGILWRDRKFKEDAANALKLTAQDLKSFGIIDTIIKEPVGGAHRDKEATIEAVKKEIYDSIETLMKIDVKNIKQNRAEKFIKMTT